MKGRKIIILVIVIGVGVAGILLLKRPASTPRTHGQIQKPNIELQAKSQAISPPPLPPPDLPPPSEVKSGSESRAPQKPPINPGDAANAKTQNTTPAPNPGDPPTTDELAREALSFVGLDLEAEQYWIEAINDPSLPAEERRNLVEDLNEDGLPDPKHPTLDDLPVLFNRIRLIEDLAPFAMDQVNAEAFAEAYKDLVNLVALAEGHGEEVK